MKKIMIVFLVVLGVASVAGAQTAIEVIRYGSGWVLGDLYGSRIHGDVGSATVEDASMFAHDRLDWMLGSLAAEDDLLAATADIHQASIEALEAVPTVTPLPTNMVTGSGAAGITPVATYVYNVDVPTPAPTLAPQDTPTPWEPLPGDNIWIETPTPGGAVAGYVIHATSGGGSGETPTPMPTNMISGDYVTPVATYVFHLDYPTPLPTATPGAGGGGETTSNAYNIGGSYLSYPQDGQLLIYVPFTSEVTFPGDFSGSVIQAASASTAEATFTIYKNDEWLAYATVPAAGTQAVFTATASISFAAGDIISLYAPDPADSTLGYLGINLEGYRQTSAEEYNVSGTYLGQPPDGQQMLYIPFTDNVSFSSDMAGSYIAAVTAPTADAVFTLYKNSGIIGYATIEAATTTASFSVDAATFEAGDVLQLFAPNPADSTLEDIGVNLLGYRIDADTTYVMLPTPVNTPTPQATATPPFGGIFAGDNIYLETPTPGGSEGIVVNATSSGGGGDVEEAPTDGEIYGRQNSSWSVIPDATLSRSSYSWIFPIDQPKSVASATDADDEFDYGDNDSDAMEAKWNFVDGATGTVNFLGTSTYTWDFESHPGHLLLQQTSTASLRQDFALADGYSVILAIDYGIVRDANTATDQDQIILGLNTDPTRLGQGTFLMFIVKTTTDESVIGLGSWDGSTAINTFCLASQRIYLRISRTGTTYVLSYSSTGNSWDVIGSYSKVAFNYIWLYGTDLAADGNATYEGITSFDWMRIGTNDFYPFTH